MEHTHKKTFVIVGGVDNTGNATNTTRIMNSPEGSKGRDVKRNFFMASGAYLEDDDVVIICGGYHGEKRSGPFIKTAMESFEFKWLDVYMIIADTTIFISYRLGSESKKTF